MFEVDPVKAPGLVGVNTALSECVPEASVVVSEAVPPLTGTGLPRGLVPSWNCTLPAADAGVTVAVSVSAVPAAAGEAGGALSCVEVAVACAAGVIAIPFGLWPTGIAVPAVLVATVIGVTVLSFWLAT